MVTMKSRPTVNRMPQFSDHCKRNLYNAMHQFHEVHSYRTLDKGGGDHHTSDKGVCNHHTSDKGVCNHHTSAKGMCNHHTPDNGVCNYQALNNGLWWQRIQASIYIKRDIGMIQLQCSLNKSSMKIGNKFIKRRPKSTCMSERRSMY